MEELDSILSATLKVPADQLGDDKGMEDVPAWDSLSHMDLILAIESHFAIELTGDDIADMVTLGAIREVIGKRVG